MDDDSSGDEWLSSAADHGTNEESDDGGGGKPAAVIAPPPIETTTLTPSTNECRTIWDDDMVLLDRSAKRWTCRWCKNTFVVNATKAVAHLSKTRGNEVQICPIGMDEFHRKRYAAFQQALDHKRSLKKRSSDRMDVVIEQHNIIVADKLDRRKEARHCGTSQKGNGASIGGGSSTNTPVSEITRSTWYHQATIKNSLSSNPSNDSKLTMAVADLIQSLGLPFSLASSPKFHKMLDLAKTCTKKFQPPHRRQIAGELLDLNYDAYMEKNMNLIKVDCEIYGLAFFGDGATIKRIPLINCLISSAHLPAACLEIVNCASHLVDGGKKTQNTSLSIFIRTLKNWKVSILAVSIWFYSMAHRTCKRLAKFFAPLSLG